MSPLRRALVFCLAVSLVAGLLLVPWPGVREAYAAVFRAGAGLVFGSFGSDGRVRFEPLQQEQPPSDTRMVMRNERTRHEAMKFISARYLGYVPVVAIITLVVSTPISWRRRGWALLWGLLLVHGFVALRVMLLLLHHFTSGGELALYTLSPFNKQVVEQVCGALVGAPPSVYVVPILIWILVTIRRGDLERWLRPDGSSRSPTESDSQ